MPGLVQIGLPVLELEMNILIFMCKMNGAVDPAFVSASVVVCEVKTSL
jgi:hypothetical protein